MLVCSVSQRPPGRTIAADIAEAIAATDALATGNVVFATLVDDPASVAEIVDAYLGSIMLEAASAGDTLDGSIPSVYTVAIVEAATAADAPDYTAAFTPIALTGLIGWWDAQVAASLNLTGSDINSVADQSGLGNTMNWSHAKPTYNATGLNSLPAIVLAYGQALTATSFPMGTGVPLTFFFVGTMGTASSDVNGRMLSYTGAGQSDDYNNLGSFIVMRNSTPALQYFKNNNPLLSLTGTAHPAVHRFIATVNSSGVMTGWVDGVSVGTSGAFGGNWISNGTFAIGRDPASTAAYFVGPIGEVGITTGNIDATTAAQLDTYLKTKWGL